MRKFTSLICFFAIIVLFNACKDKTAESSKNPKPQTTEKTNKIAASFAQSIAETHEKEAFLKFDALRYHFSVSLENNENYASFIQATNGTNLLVNKKDGTKLYFTEEELFVSPSSYSPTSLDKQTALWGFLFSLPQKLNTYKGNWTDKKEEVLQKDTLVSVGFTPHGLLKNRLKNIRVYADKNTNLVKAVTVETTSASVPKAFAVFYEHYYTTKNIPVCSSWKIYSWPPETDKLEGQIGSARIKNLKFIEDAQGYFKIPQNAKKIAL